MKPNAASARSIFGTRSVSVASVVALVLGCGEGGTGNLGNTGGRPGAPGYASGMDDGGSGTGDEGGGQLALADSCSRKINAYRASVGAAPLTTNSAEIACALDQATKGAADRATSGRTVFHEYFMRCHERYQNECWYSDDDPSVVIDWCLDSMWKEGPPSSGINHYSVMVDTKSQSVACGLHHMDGGGYWMTNDYYQ